MEDKAPKLKTSLEFSGNDVSGPGPGDPGLGWKPTSWAPQASPEAVPLRADPRVLFPRDTERQRAPQKRAKQGRGAAPKCHPWTSCKGFAASGHRSRWSLGEFYSKSHFGTTKKDDLFKRKAFLRKSERFWDCSRKRRVLGWAG